MPPPRKKARLNPSKHTVHDVDPKGDIVIEAGTKKTTTLIRVSKDVLTSTSPVFKVMLGPDFAEGQRTHTVEQPLKLNDDDGPALLMLLQIVSGAITDGSDVKPWLLPQLVLLGDKYDCLDQLRPWVQVALGIWREQSDNKYTFGLSIGYKDQEILPINEAIRVAFLTDDSANFGALSHALFHILHDGDKGIMEYQVPLDDLMPAEFKELLAHAYAYAQTRAKEVYYQPIEEIGQESVVEDNVLQPAVTCSEGESRLLTYTRVLMSDPRFRQMDATAYLHPPRSNVVSSTSRPVIDLTVQRVPGPRIVNSFEVDMKDGPLRQLAQQDAQRKCGKRCLCRKPLCEIVHELHLLASKQIGLVCLRCIKEGRSYGFIIPGGERKCTRCQQ